MADAEIDVRGGRRGVLTCGPPIFAVVLLKGGGFGDCFRLSLLRYTCFCNVISLDSSVENPAQISASDTFIFLLPSEASKRNLAAFSTLGQSFILLPIVLQISMVGCYVTPGASADPYLMRLQINLGSLWVVSHRLKNCQTGRFQQSDYAIFISSAPLGSQPKSF
jgi:hypothetical protein